MMMKHKIIIGDSRGMKEIEDDSVHLMVTSPPYYGVPMWQKFLKNIGVEYIGPSHSQRKKLPKKEVIKNNKEGEKIFHDYLDRVWKECYRVLVPGARCAINVMNIHNSTHGIWFNTDEIRKRMFDIGFVQREEIIWLKEGQQHHSPMGSAFYPWGTLLTNLIEHIMIFQKPGKRDVSKVPKDIKEKSKLLWRELRDWTDKNVWVMKAASATKEKHLAPYPLEVPWRIIKLYTFIGDTVLDPFLGSGTTTQAASILKRNSIGYEIDESFLDIIKKKVRMSELTIGMEPVEFEKREQDVFKVIRQGKEHTMDVSFKKKKEKKLPPGFMNLNRWFK